MDQDTSLPKLHTYQNLDFVDSNAKRITDTPVYKKLQSCSQENTDRQGEKSTEKRERERVVGF